MARDYPLQDRQRSEMSAIHIHEFTVPIHENSEGTVIVLWPCGGQALRRYVMERFGLDPGERDTWDGKCYFSPDLDLKLGRPSAVIAMRIWGLNLKNPAHWESNSHLLSLLAHECFHAAEWMLRRTDAVRPTAKGSGDWEAWEDAAYLLQRIMRRSLERMLTHES
jgi:hypothetical protein